ncbi:hypothetical protein ES288_D05G328500v1 [Gossypium darwinii]|uniref:Uncharacterized protein n=1 Tax=Gossypium darwinii TaxID=34276 RepID=A0A5D2CPH5_GOSDA|nr:hypothetical protein ES288_D05G328500v1 [Gossypium darwinii]
MENLLPLLLKVLCFYSIKYLKFTSSTSLHFQYHSFSSLKLEFMATSIDPRLSEAARLGNIDAFYAIIQEDPYILDHIDQIPFVHTPLHIAAHEGQILFAMEMMNLKPSFARKLNRDGFSPMHLALRNGQIKLVLGLLKADKDLVRVKGREGMTPLHWVVTMGNSNLLIEFLEACPECIEDVTVLNKTALHLALKNDQTDAFNLLIGWLQTNCRKGALALEKEVLNWRDNNDNTMLHIAASKGLRQELRLVLDSFVLFSIDLQAKNSQGLTALEILRDVRQAVNSSEDDTTTTKIKRLKKKVHTYKILGRSAARSRANLSAEMLNAMLVVLGLVITAIYQSSLSPPGGVWQADNTNSSTSDPLFPTSNNVTLHFIEVKGSIAKHLIGAESRKAGTTTMEPVPYFIFFFLTSTAFMVSIFYTLWFTSHVSSIVVGPVYFLGISYFWSMAILAPSADLSGINILYTFVFFTAPFLALSVRMLRHLVSPSSNYTEWIHLRIAVCGARNVGIAQIFRFLILPPYIA